MIIKLNQGNTVCIDWVLTDETTALPVNDCVLTAQLYKDRSLSNPLAAPGTSVLGSIPMDFIGDGLYRGSTIPGAVEFRDDYVLVLNGVSPTVGTYHHEEQAAVVVNMDA